MGVDAAVNISGVSAVDTSTRSAPEGLSANVVSENPYVQKAKTNMSSELAQEMMVDSIIADVKTEISSPVSANDLLLKGELMNAGLTKEASQKVIDDKNGVTTPNC